ncbi:MAG: bacteriocin fulvocin C-related protein [Mangrovibacterium sp.]
MKIALLFVCLLSILFSCRQAEFEFSCDPVINAYVLENREKLLKMPVTEFADFDLPLQKAVYNSWDPQKKRDVWIGKIKHVLSSGFFSDEERSHLQKLIDHIGTDYFVEVKIEENQADRYLFENEWVSYATGKLGWSDYYVAFLVYRLYTDPYQFNDELSMLEGLARNISVNPESGSCACNTSSDYCGAYNCTFNGCSTTSGCGWLWTAQCNGVCEDPS